MFVAVMTESAVGGPDTVVGFARRPVLLVAGAATVLLLAVSWRFGYFGDELYFVAAARHHLEWGYADNPWLLPVLAKAVDTVLPGSVVALRVLAALAHGGGIVLAALHAREFGGRARAQTMAAAAYAISPQLLGSGHILATSTVDPFLWTLTTWLVVRWLRTRSDRALLVATLVTAVAMQGKFLIVFFWLAFGAAVLVVGPRSLLRRPVLWIGAAVTVLATVPTLLWQVHNGWPYLGMAAVVDQQADQIGGPALLLPLAVVFAGLLVGAFLVCHGWWQLLRDPGFARYRALGWAVPVLVVIFLLTGPRYYYLAGLYGLLFAASAVRIERRRPAAWWRWVPSWPVFVLSALFAVLVSLPVLPRSAVTSVQFTASGSIGWPTVADTVAGAYRGLGPGSGAVVVTETYWEASALEMYGGGRLPAVYGSERGYWYFGRPPEGTATVLFVGKDTTRDQLLADFTDVRQVAVTHLDVAADNVNQNVRVWACTGPRATWAQLWDRLHRP